PVVGFSRLSDRLPEISFRRTPRNARFRRNVAVWHMTLWSQNSLVGPLALRVSDAGPTQKLGRGLKGRRRKASEGGNRGPLRWRRRGVWAYGDLRAGRSVERGSRPAWSAWSGMFEAICEGGSREEAQATDRRKTVLAAADEGGVSGNMPPRPDGES